MKEEILVYSGTTLMNFVTCAYINSRDQVVFDKRKEPKHAHPGFYYDERFGTAFQFARNCASNRGAEHIPVVMRGVRKDSGYSYMFPGQLFRVVEVLVPNADIDVRELDTVFDRDLESKFHSVASEEILELS